MKVEQTRERIRRWLDAGVRFSRVDGQVIVQGPRAALDEEDSQWLRDNKPLLLQWLNQEPERLAEADWPASDVQAAMWVASRMTPDLCAYNLLLGIRLHQPLDEPRLLAATRRLLQRNDALRTGLYEADTGLRARLLPVVVPPLHRLDGDGPGLPARIDQWADQPFDLERGPLLRLARLARPDAVQWAALDFPPDGNPDAELLFLCCHHLAVDLWGLQLLLQQWLHLYSAGTDTGLPTPLPYRAFTPWQQQYLASAQGQGDGEYWQEHWLKRPAGDIPWQRPGSDRSFRGQRIVRRLSAAETGQVRALARRCNTTPFVVLLTVFAAVEARYHGRRHAVIGSPVAGRSAPGSEQTVGHFVNLLVQWLAIDADGWVSQIQSVRDGWMQAMSHADYPFPRILAALQALQSGAVADLPEAVLVWHQAGAQWLAQMGELPSHLIRSLQDIWAGSGQRGAAYPVVLAVLDQGQDYRLEWTFDNGLFETALMTQRVEDFLAALASALGDRPVAPADLPLVSPSRVEGGSDAVRHPDSLWLRVDQQRQQQPDAIALFDALGGRSLTWQQLAARAEALATRLVAAGAGPGHRIGLWLDRTLHWPVACVACWRINAAFVPLDRAAPASRIADILDDAAIGCLISDDPHVEVPAGVCLIPADAAPVADEGSYPFVPDPHACAYVIYTSGSTGRPKGVAVSQRNLLAYSDGFEALSRQPARSIATFTPYTFDVSLFELGGSLLQGRELIVLPDLLALDRDRWQALLFSRPIDMLYLPPGLLDSLRDAWVQSGQPLPARLMTGVEPIAYERLWCWLDLKPDMDVINHYGPTEATVAATWLRVEARGDAAQAGERVPLGHAMPGTCIELRDGCGRLVPRGCAGEALILGAQVAQGYIGHAAAGDTRFIQTTRGEPGYRTGDWMRLDDAGLLLYLGRADHQIKLRGVRVELGEVRAALMTLPGVGDAWVEARRHDTGIPFLVAHVASHEPAASLLAQLRQLLPPLLVPAYLLARPELPLNRHGKVDAAALAALPLDSDDQERRGPQSVSEQVLWQAWCQELPQPPRHVAENFYALGGHSLIATRIASRLLAAGFQVKVADLLRHLDIETQARCLAPATRVQGLPRAIDGPIAISGPALPFQFSLWAHENMQGPSRAYTVPFACRFAVPPPFEWVEAQWSRLMWRHEALRTGFAEVGLGVQQQVRQDWKVPLYRQRLAVADGQDLHGQLQQRARECLLEPLAMTADAPLWRVHWFDIDAPAAGSLMVALFHHSIFDGTSVQALAEEWQSGTLPHGVRLPAMIEAATELQQQLQAVLDPGLTFWHDALARCESVDLPRRESPQAADEPSLHRLTAPFTATQRRHLDQVARQLGCSPFVVAFTLYQLVLARFSDHLNLAVAIPVDLRDAQYRGVVGGLVNTLSIPCAFDWHDRLADAIGKTGAFLRACQPYRAVPLDRVMQTFEGSPQQWLDTLFGCIFVWEDLPVEQGGLPVDWLRLHPAEAKTDIEMLVGDDGLHLLWRSGRFETVSLQSLLDSFGFVLAQCADRLDEKVGWLPLFDDAAFAGQVQALCGQVCFLPPADTVLDRIDAQVQQRPQQWAVCRLEQGIRYHDLRRQALDYAAGLQQAGVQPGDRVAFCLDRVPDTLALLLGLWQAGAAYVPIDPRWPEERRARVLAAAGCRCLLVEPGTAAPRVPDGLPVWSRHDLRGQWQGPARLHLPAQAHTAYVLFTSGSTGEPKGVVISHHNLAAFLRWIERFYPAGDFAGFLAVTPFTFDISVFELFGTLSRGGTLYLGEDPLALLDPAVRHAYAGKLTFLCSVPSAATAWLDAGVIPPGIHTVNMGGEWLSPTLVDRFYQAGVGRVLDLWGPTEDTTYSMVALRTPGGVAHIGKPIDDTQMWVVDSRLQPQPRGVKGELLLGGLGLSDGYLNAAEATARVFIPNPFLARFPHWAARVYRSGDIGWQDAGDDLHYCARADFQLKIRGQRLEAGDIETCLRRHPAVRTAVVMLHRIGEAPPFLLACVEAEPGTALDFVALADFVRRALPAYMVPGQWLCIERWPLNGNGKIDRRQVQALAQASALWSAPVDDVQPVSALEETLLAVCAATLGESKVSLTVPLDQAGVDSIALLKLNFALQKALDLPQPLPLSLWLQQRTLRAVAACLDDGFPLRTWTRLNDAPDSAPVLACIHAVGGEITGFRRLAQALGTRWQVWAVALPSDLSGTTGLAALAARYARAWPEIGARRVTLLGYSLGGLIGAHLLAPLQAQGVTVDRLLLLDSHTPAALGENPVIRGYAEAVAAADAHWPTLYEVAVQAGWVPAGLTVESLLPRLRAIGHLLRVTLPEPLPVIDVPVQHLASTVDGGAARRDWCEHCVLAPDFFSTPAWHGAVLEAAYLDPVLALLATGEALSFP